MVAIENHGEKNRGKLMYFFKPHIKIIIKKDKLIGLFPIGFYNFNYFLNLKTGIYVEPKRKQSNHIKPN